MKKAASNKVSKTKIEFVEFPNDTVEIHKIMHLFVDCRTVNTPIHNFRELKQSDIASFDIYTSLNYMNFNLFFTTKTITYDLNLYKLIDS
jgi:hypothetical protein